MDFQDGQTKNIGGTTYVRQGGVWHPQGGPVYGAPPKPTPPPTGYAETPGGLTPVTGGPADEPATANLPTGWERPTPRAPAQRIPGLPEHITDPKSEGDAKVTVDERTAAFLATRVAGGIKDLSTVLRESPDAAAPPLGSAIVGKIAGEDAKNYANDANRQRIEAAQMDILDAALTLGTGAAYSPEQLKSYTRSYFPQLGDEPATIADKDVRLRRLLEAAKIKAGAAAPAIDEALNRLGTDPASAAGANAGADAGAIVAQGAPAGRQMTPEQEQQFLEILRTKGPQAAAEHLAKLGFQTQDPEALSKPYTPQVEYPNVSRLAEGIGGVVEGVGDVVGMVSNPVNAGVNALFGTDFSTDVGKSLREGVGLPTASTPTQAIVNTAGQTALMGGGLAGLARKAAPYVTGAVGNALQSFGAAPGADMAISGVSGASAEAAGQAGGGQAAQLIAALLGGGLAAPAALRASGAMTRPSGPAGNALTRAGEAENVTVNRAMADPNAQQKVTAIGRSMVGGNIMNRQMGRISGEIEGRVQSLGQGGQALNEPAAVGKTVQGIGKRYIQASGAEFKGRYTALKAEAGGVPIPPSESVSHIDAILGELSKLPRQNAKEIKYLEDIKADIANGIDVESARSIGSRLSKDISKGEVTFGPAERNVLDIRKALARDTEAGLTAAGKANTAARYREVDAAYSQRMDFIRQKLQGLLGKRNAPLDPEKAAGRLKTMAGERGDAAGLYQILNKATPEERADIAATFANDLGKGNDGQFSVANFVSDIEKIPASARVALWGKEGAKTLDNLTLLGNEHKRVTKAMGGSPTAVAGDYKGYLINFLFGGGLGMVQGGLSSAAALAGVGVAAKAGRDIVNARILMNKDVVNWLRTAPRTTDPKAINAHHARLKAIAARQPAIAGDIQQIEQAMMRAANENVSPSVAASESEQDR